MSGTAGKTSAGAAKKVSSTAGGGTQASSTGASKKIRRGHHAVRYYPAVISNLSAQTGARHGEAVLSWTAPGANGLRGRAARYRIAYATAPIANEAGFAAAAAYSQSFTPLAAGATETVTLTGLPAGTTLYFSVRGVEPGGNRGRVSNSPYAYTLLPASVSGSVSYSGTQGGRIVVAVVDSTHIFTTANISVSTQMTVADGFGLSGLQPNATFYLAGFVDVNQSLRADAGEDYGFYGGATPTPMTLAPGGSASGLNFSILTASAASMGTVAGAVAYAGAQPGTLRIELFNNQAFTGLPVAALSTAAAGAYSFMVPGDVAYFMRAFIDGDADAHYDAGEAFGLYSPNNQGAEAVYVARQATVSGKNITVYDPGCTAAGCSGLGTASASAASVTAGSQASFNIKVIVGQGGLQAGGTAGLGVPAGWGTLQNTCPSCAGYATLTVLTGGAASVALDADPATPAVEPLSGSYSAVAKVVSGSLSAGDTVQFNLGSIQAPCAARVSTFTAATAQNPLVPALQLAAGSPAVAVQPGGAVTLAFTPASLTLTQYTTSQALLLSGKDLCGGSAAVAVSTSVSVSGNVYSFTTGLFSPDAALKLSTSAGDGFATPRTVDFAAGQSSAALYALSSSTGAKSVQAEYLLDGATRYAYCSVNVLQGDPFSGVGVASGAFSGGRSSMTITPDGDGAGDAAFVIFSLADQSLAWTVQISSQQYEFDGSVVWQAQGYGSALPGRVAWDGRFNVGADSGRPVRPGDYYVRVAAGGVYNDTMVITVVASQLSGQVTDPGITPAVPVPDARVQLFGPVQGQAYTDSSGRYMFSGLAVGTYTVTFAKAQYVAASSRAVVAGASTVLDMPLARAPILEITPSLQPGATQAYDQWGALSVYTTGWALNYTQPVRLPAGTTTFDDGGQWDASLQQFVTRTRFRFEVTAGTYTAAAALSGYFPVSTSVYVGPAGLSLALPQLNRRVNVGGSVSLSTLTNPAPNPSGLTVSVVALSSGVARASALVSLPAGVVSGSYLVTGLEPGSYTMRAYAPGFEPVSVGPVAVAAADLAGVNLPAFAEGGVLSGVITVSGDTSAFPPLSGSSSSISVGITAWSQQTAAQGRAAVRISSSASSGQAAYAITGLRPGATYQVFADIAFSADAAFQSPGGFPKTVYISSVTQAASLNFSFVKASGAVAGLIRLPDPAAELGAPEPDFTRATLKWRILRSDDPLRVGRSYELASSTALPNFLCGGVTASTGTFPGCAAGVSSATFRLTGLRTETLELTLSYGPTGLSRTVYVPAVNGSTVAAALDLRGDTYAISGRIVNQVSEPLFNTNALIAQNAPYEALPGYPAGVSSTTARVEAVRRDFGELLTQVSTTAFDAAKTRVGLLDAAGNYSITGMQNGLYLVRTLPLRAYATGPVLVPAKEQLVSVANASRTGIDFTLSDGFSVSGRVALDQGLYDYRTLRLTLRNRRGELEQQQDLLLGNPGAGIAAASADFLFERVPLGGFYTIEAADLGSPVKYLARPLTFPDRAAYPDGLQGETAGLELTLKRAGAITGRLRDANSGDLITEANAALLAPNFRIYAVANPWVEGGYVTAQSSAAGRPIEADGTFRLEPLAPGVVYDVHMEQEAWDMAYLNAGSQNYAPAVSAQVGVGAGQVKDIGIVDLNQGQSITGTVYGLGGERLPNITMTAVPALVATPASVNTQTASDGTYTLWVSSFISRYFDVTAAARGGQQQASDAVLYSQKTLRVDLQRSSAADFTLEPLLGSLTGQVLTGDGGPLSYPAGGQKGFPAAAVYLQPQGTLPSLNPYGDITAQTDTGGRFEVPGLSTGSYSLSVVSLGYLPWSGSVAVTTGTVSAGTITLTRAATVSGSIRKADPASPTGWSCPNAQEVSGVAAADSGFAQYLPGTVEEDPLTRTICSYEVSGFLPGYDYQLALLGASAEDAVFPSEGAVSFAAEESTATKTVNLTYRVTVPECQPTFQYLGNDQVKLTFRCNKALRNETGLDNDLDYILNLATYAANGSPLASPDGTGQFLGADKRLEQGRKDLTAIYRPAAGEERFSVRLRAFTAALDPNTGANYELDQVYDFFTAVDSSKSKKINNINGGTLDMESEADFESIENSNVGVAPGTFVLEGSTTPVPGTSVELGMNKGRTRQQAEAQALAAPARVSAYDARRTRTPGSFPPRIAAAMLALRSGRVEGYRPQAAGSAQVTPFSAFYDIFLPAGIKHALKNKARITISYDASLSTSAALTNLNIWYFNPSTQRFEMEADGKQIDTANSTVSSLVDHFSVFVVLASTPLYTSTSPYAGAELEAFNFPNPFNLETKTKALNLNAGGGSYSSGSVQVTTRGTIIRAGVPRAVSGQGKIRIYTLAGELVREYDCGWLDGAAGASGSGTYYYFEWDGRNGAGREVASDVYLGELTVGGKKKVWKMAVIKDPKYR